MQKLVIRARFDVVSVCWKLQERLIDAFIFKDMMSQPYIELIWCFVNNTLMDCVMCLVLVLLNRFVGFHLDVFGFVQTKKKIVFFTFSSLVGYLFSSAVFFSF